MKMLQEFKEFISRGSVVDMAIGVVIGGAFKGIVDALVNHILNPLVGFALAGVRFDQLAVVLRPAQGDVPALTLGYGALIQSIVSFLITAFVLFLLVKAYNRVRRSFEKPQADQPAAPASPSDNELLQAILTELRQQNHHGQ